MPGPEQIHKTSLKRNKLSPGHNVRMDPNLGNGHTHCSVPHLPTVIRVSPEAVTSILALDDFGGCVCPSHVLCPWQTVSSLQHKAEALPSLSIEDS